MVRGGLTAPYRADKVHALHGTSREDGQADRMVPYARRTPDAVRPGNIVTADGAVVGTHGGHQHFTLGQRKGVGVAFGYPIYVTGIDAAQNIVTVGTRDQLLRRQLVAREVNWIAGPPPLEPLACTAKIRYNSPPAAAVARMTGPDELTVTFQEPIAAITPGQAVVCYDADRLLGGGWIDDVHY